MEYEGALLALATGDLVGLQIIISIITFTFPTPLFVSLLSVIIIIRHLGWGQHDIKLKNPGCANKARHCTDQDHRHDYHHEFHHEYQPPYSQGVVIHEMLHRLGISHEHKRPDRDSFLDIDWTNMPIKKVIMMMMTMVIFKTS